MSLNLDKSRWTRVKFGEVVFNVNSAVKDAEAAGLDRVIAMEHLDPGELRIQRWGKVEDGTTFTRQVKPGQTLFGKRRAYQRKVAYAEFDAICSGDILTFQANETDLLPEFLPFLVQSDGFFAHALGTSAGSLSPRTNWTDLSDFEFDLPPLDEQKRLADLLWRLEEHRNSLTDSLLEIGLTRDQFIEFNLPQGSSETILGEAASIISGVTLGPSRKTMPNKASYLRVANVQRGSLDLSEIKEIGVTAAEVQTKGLLSGDVLVVEGHASVMEIGRAAIWESAESVLFQNHIFRVRAKDDFLPRFLLEWINSTRGRAYMRSVAKSTSGLNTINSTVLKAMPVPIMDLDQQRKLLENIASIDASMQANALELKSLKEAQAAIGSYIFGGAQ